MTFRPVVQLPGETVELAVKRRVKMHEFLMKGGIRDGLDKFNRVQYTGPVSPTTHPVCPWHAEDCIAWYEIAEGRGYDGVEEIEPDIVERRLSTTVTDADRKRWADRKPMLEESGYERRQSQGQGNPWDRKPMFEYTEEDAAFSEMREAIASGLSGDQPEEIVIDGDEGEEGDE